MIEMKDLQEGASLDGHDEEFGVVEMQPRSYLPVHGDDAADGPAESGVWSQRRFGKQNRCMVLLMGTLLLAAIIYVVGMVYLSDDDMDALVQPFERESGIVEDGMENEKEQEAFDSINTGNRSPINAKKHQHFGGHDNPFASKVNSVSFRPEDQQQQQGQTSKGSGGRNGNLGGRLGKIGQNGHFDGKRPGAFSQHASDGNGGISASTGNQNMDSQGDFSNNDGHSDTASSQAKSQEVIDEKDVYCEDLTRYQIWYDATITKADGPQFLVVHQMQHDHKAFTQGLTYARGQLFESTGLYGQSTIRILDPDTANVLKTVPMDNRLFGEGMAYYKDTLVQITWKSQKGFIYNMTTLETIHEYQFASTRNEGWGITWDRCKDELIITDGSEFLHFWDPNTMTEKRKVSVTRQNGKKALEMNEIEFWRGRVLANVWYEDVLLVIDPETGTVEKEYDFSTLWPAKDRSAEGADVLNGISVSKDPDILYVTGKNWNRMFTVELLPSLS
ncbi:glutaminyl-tRNA synthetase [Nitzschia inconspicua]|uniref:Glutaminyl-tRNA synthetase n=1 Tax=Nitzschia inconspicua TaxID=303405 RepID=A0A9K3KP56_9STRA|nr:glutaminyl-tRNA synthetase [Nitzschia inconspicua]